MKKIRYRVTFADGATETHDVSARSINSGFSKVLRRALEPLGSGRRRDVHSVEFSEVRS